MGNYSGGFCEIRSQIKKPKIKFENGNLQCHKDVKGIFQKFKFDNDF